MQDVCRFSNKNPSSSATSGFWNCDARLDRSLWEKSRVELNLHFAAGPSSEPYPANPFQKCCLNTSNQHELSIPGLWMAPMSCPAHSHSHLRVVRTARRPHRLCPSMNLLMKHCNCIAVTTTDLALASRNPSSRHVTLACCEHGQ